MPRVRFACAALFCGAIATVLSAAPGGVPGPPAGKGQASKGIGPLVAAQAKAGVHGAQLVAQIKGFQAAKGIGGGVGAAPGRGIMPAGKQGMPAPGGPAAGNGKAGKQGMPAPGGKPAAAGKGKAGR